MSLFIKHKSVKKYCTFLHCITTPSRLRWYFRRRKRFRAAILKQLALLDPCLQSALVQPGQDQNCLVIPSMSIVFVRCKGVSFLNETCILHTRQNLLLVPRSRRQRPFNFLEINSSTCHVFKCRTLWMADNFFFLCFRSKRLERAWAIPWVLENEKHWNEAKLWMRRSKQNRNESRTKVRWSRRDMRMARNLGHAHADDTANETKNVSVLLFLWKQI